MRTGRKIVSSKNERVRFLGQREGAGERSEADGKKWARSRSNTGSWSILKGYGLHPRKTGKPAKDFEEGAVMIRFIFKRSFCLPCG